MENFKQKITATMNKEGDFYEHFNIHPITASLYGNKKSEIFKVELSISNNQKLPKEKEENMKTPDYWGWFDKNQEKFTMIYAKRFLLNMCFPSGIEAAEHSGQGKSYRLNVKLIKK